MSCTTKDIYAIIFSRCHVSSLSAHASLWIISSAFIMLVFVSCAIYFNLLVLRIAHFIVEDAKIALRIPTVLSSFQNLWASKISKMVSERLGHSHIFIHLLLTCPKIPAAYSFPHSLTASETTLTFIWRIRTIPSVFSKCPHSHFPIKYRLGLRSKFFQILSPVYLQASLYPKRLLQMQHFPWWQQEMLYFPRQLGISKDLWFLDMKKSSTLPSDEDEQHGAVDRLGGAINWTQLSIPRRLQYPTLERRNWIISNIRKWTPLLPNQK